MKSTVLSAFIISSLGVAMFAGLIGCQKSPAQKANTNFFTSGSREADQRASQRMAQAEQLAGSGEGAGEKGVKKAKVKKPDENPATPSPTGSTNGTNVAAQDTEKLALFNRLGGEAGISNLVADFLPRVMDDPRVNWSRRGVTQGGFSIHAGKSVAWNPTSQHIELLKGHMIEFLA